MTSVEAAEAVVTTPPMRCKSFGTTPKRAWVLLRHPWLWLELRKDRHA